MFRRSTLVLLTCCAIIALLLLTPEEVALNLEKKAGSLSADGTLISASELEISAKKKAQALRRTVVEPLKETRLYGIPVLVLNESGEPQAQVPLALWNVISGRSVAWKQRVTDETGHAFFELVPPTGAYDFDCRLGFPFPCGEAKAVDFAFSNTPTDLVTLTLPALGSIEVQLLDVDGNAWTRPTEIRLTTPQASAAANRRFLKTIGNGIGALTSDANGRITFLCPANQAAKLLGAFNNPWGTWELKKVFAPAKPGETVNATLQLLKPKPVLKFRLVDPSGTPVIRKEWSGWLVNYNGTKNDNSPGIYGRFKQTTDEAGYSEIPVAEGQDAKPWLHRLLRLRCRPEDGGQEMAADYDLSTDFPLGIHHLGDVVLQAQTILVSGKVNSKSGLALQNLKLESKVDWGGKHDSIHHGFLQNYPHEITVQEDGAFFISGATQMQRMQLKVSADGHHPAALSLDIPVNQVSIELKKSLSVSGQIESEEGYDLTQLLYFFESADYTMPRPEPPDFTSHYLGHLAPKMDGHFEVKHIHRATPGRLTIYQGSRRQPILVLDNVTPAAEGVAQDLRLNPLVLPDFHTYQFHAVNTSGGDIDMLRYRILEPTMASDFNPAEGMGIASDWGSSSYTLTSALPQVLIGVFALGYRYQEISLGPGETEIVLEKALQIRVKLNAPLIAPIGTRLRVQLKSEEAAGLAERSIWLPPFHLGALPAIDFPGPGSYRIELELHDKKTRKSVGVLWGGGQGAYTFYVQDQAEQTVEIPFPTSGIQDAAKTLKEK